MSRHDERAVSAFAQVRRLLRAVGLIDAAALSVRNAARRLPHTRAALLRYRLATLHPGGKI